MMVQYSESNLTKSSHSVITAKCSATNNLELLLLLLLSHHTTVGFHARQNILVKEAGALQGWQKQLLISPVISLQLSMKS